MRKPLRFWRPAGAIVFALLVCVSRLPAQDAPAQDAPAQDAPAQDAPAQEAPPRGADDSNTMALIGGRVVTQSSAGVLEGDVLIADGNIVGVGRDLAIPDKAKRVDVRGFTVTPGLLDIRSALWLTTAAAGEGAADGSLNVLDGVDVFAEDWREVARQGVTAVYVQPASKGNLGGRGAVLRVAPAKSLEDILLLAEAGAQASIGIGGKSGTSRDRFAQYERIKKALAAAKTYREQWQKYEQHQKEKSQKKADASKADGSKPKEGKAEKTSMAKGDTEKQEGSSDKSAEPKKPPTKPTFDASKEFLSRVLDRKIPLRIEVHRDDDIANALKLAKEFKLRITVEGASNPHSSLDDLIQSRAPLVLGPIVSAGSADYRKFRPDNWLTGLTRHDVRWALATFAGQPRESRLLRVHAATAVAAGIDPADALRAITSNAAALVGLGDKLGSLEAGKQADVVVFAGEPLDPSTRVRLVISRGEIVYQSPAAAPPALIRSRAKRLPTSLPAAFAVRSRQFLHDSGSFGAGQLVVKNGQIASFSRDRDAPAGVPLFDLGSTMITPPLIVAHTDLGLSGQVDDKVDAIAPDLRAADAYDPSSAAGRKLCDAGFLLAAFAPGSGNVLGGNVACVRLGAAAPIWSATAGLKFTLTEKARDVNRFPASLAGQTQLVRQVLEQGHFDSRLLLPEPVRAELMAERRKQLSALLKKKSVAMFEVSSPAEIRAALALIEEFELRGALVHPQEVAPFVDDLKRLQVGIVARAVQPGDYDRYLDELVAASRRGVAIAFGSGSAMDCRTTAALAVAAGMSPQTALCGLTNRAARLVGAPRRAGRFAAKAPADFVVWSGSPLDLCQKPVQVIVDGKLVGQHPLLHKPPPDK